MLQTTFEKKVAQNYLACLMAGKTVGPSHSQGWSTHDMVMLAGACLNMTSYLPGALEIVKRPEYAKTEREEEQLNQMQNEILRGELEKDILEAISWAAELCDEIVEESYDSEYEETVTAKFDSFRILSGLKEMPEDEDDEVVRF